MAREPLTYAVITPARNEAENLRRLADSLATQVVMPAAWIIVDDGSVDDTAEIADELADRVPSIRVVSGGCGSNANQLGRGPSIVCAFHTGIASLEEKSDLIAKVDADISFGPDYFGRLIEAFANDPALGMASGTCYEHDSGEWRQKHLTGVMVWGAARAYRRACLEEILPLEERMGWDGIDVVKANVRGWATRTLLDLPFRHHRKEAGRERSRWYGWVAQGDACHYMGYRPLYLFVRTAHRMRRDPAALGMLWGFIAAVAKRGPKCPDSSVRDHVRRMQGVRHLPARRREAAGR